MATTTKDDVMAMLMPTLVKIMMPRMTMMMMMMMTMSLVMTMRCDDGVHDADTNVANACANFRPTNG